MRRIETYDWWPELVRLKDHLSLRELAEKFDVTPGAISAAFKRSGVSRKPAPPGPRARRRLGDEQLPPEPGEVGAEEARPGSKDARILPFRDVLGTVPDSIVAKKAGVSVRTIASFRARNKIAGYSGPRRRGADRAPRKSRIDPFAHLVGTVPDRVVAEKANVSVNAVRNWRIKHQVASIGRRSLDPAHPSSLGEGPSTNGGVGAWKVIVSQGGDRVVRVVVAESLADAASRVESADLGQIVALEWIGEVV